jgi:hypothetical protein
MMTVELLTCVKHLDCYSDLGRNDAHALARLAADLAGGFP